MTDLRCGPWQDVLADVGEVDALICDPPYSERTHSGHGRLRNGDGSLRTSEIGYDAFTEEDVRELCAQWSPRVRGWMCFHTSHDLLASYAAALEDAGRYVFAPVPCVMRGMSIRLQGDGPSSWTCWLIVARRRSAEACKWGTLPGAYVGTPPSRASAHGAKSIVMGQKPLWLMNAIVRDYSRPGDLVCDPFSGGGTTALACSSLGRRFVGAEIDPETFAKAQKRLSKGTTIDMFPESVTA